MKSDLSILPRLGIGILLFLLATVPSVLAQTATVPTGSGTSGDPYLISSLENLYWLSQTSSVWDDNAYFEQTADIDASETSTWDDGAGFSPIGNYTDKFTGRYDGNEHTITGLTINRPDDDYIGLFGYVLSGDLQNIGLMNAAITGEDQVGALAGYMKSSTLINAYSSGSVTGDDNTGGLIGYLDSNLNPAYNLHSSAEVTATGYEIGGLIGYAKYVNMYNSYATGKVTGEGEVGGLVGLFESDRGEYLHTVYATGEVTASSDKAGGLIGSADYVDDIYTCYATGNVTGDASVGGLIGGNYGNTVTDCYSSGAVSGTSNVGGFIGVTDDGSVSNAYWDSVASGQSSAIGSIYSNPTTDITGLTSSEMLIKSNFDLGDDWLQYSGFSLPFLKNFPPDSINGIPYASYSPEGSGTSGDPYEIANLLNLYWLSQIDSVWDDNAYFEQTADIDASETSTWDDGAGFSPIGNYTDKFTGRYDGNEHTITGLTINRPDDDYIGLFGYVLSGDLQNIGLMNAAITGEDQVGALAGYMKSSTLINAYSSGSVTGDDNTGGLIGYLDSNLNPAYNLHSSAEVTGTGYEIGGLIGYAKYVNMYNSYATGKVTGETEVGGLIGFYDSDDGFFLHTVYATGEVTANSDKAGGLIGEAAYVDDIYTCYATGNVSGDASVGGLIGSNYGNTVTDCYSSGAVSGTSNVGGFIGVTDDGSVSNAYWDSVASGQSSAIGIIQENPTIDITGLTSSEMLHKTNFDFDADWTQYDGFTTPFLTIFPPDSINGYAYSSYQPEGSGTSGDPYEIANLLNLYWLSQIDSVWDDSAYFEQTADIDASETSTWDDGSGFFPIGTSDSTYFTGIYDGDNHTITGLIINRSDEDYIGLFGYVSEGDIQNIGLPDVSITGNEQVGALAGELYSTTLINAYSTGSVSGNYDVGGLIGYYHETSTAAYKLYSTADVTSSGSAIGGLMGRVLDINLHTSYATGNVTGHSVIGGLAGRYQSTNGEYLHTVYATGKVTANNFQAGGLIGFSNQVTTYNCYATGDVSGKSAVGGLIGYNISSNTDCYSNGAVSGTEKFGGLVGVNYSGSLSNTYWDSLASGQSSGIGTDNNSQTTTALTTSEMLDKSNFNFPTDWAQYNGFTNPFLTALPPDSINGYPYSNYEPGGSGTSGDPYEIANLQNLHWLSQIDSVWDDNAYFEQTADIDASETIAWEDSAGFTPIGNFYDEFTGTYDGDNHTITGLSIYRSKNNYTGLFGYVSDGDIQNIGLVDAAIKGKYYVGALAGYIESSTLVNAYSTGSVSGVYVIGGLAGYLRNGNPVYNLHSSADITASSSLIGGLIGTVENQSMYNSYATGDVSGKGQVGGLVGEYTASESEYLHTVYATGEVTSGSPRTGGLIGDASYIGSIYNCYASSDVTGTTSVGGLFGLNYGNTITDCYSSGAVSGTSDTGGFIGANYEGNISSSYWYNSSDAEMEAIGTNDNSQIVEELNAGQMIDSTSFDGWDFSSIDAWSIDQGFAFPYLADMGEFRTVVATIDSAEGWRMIGHPGDVTYSKLLAPIWTQGFTGADSESGTSNVYVYDEATYGWNTPSSADDYFGSASSDAANTDLNGVLLYVYGDDDNDGSEDAWPKYLVSKNTTLSESYDVNLDFTTSISQDSAGWNMLSNPYPVSLDFTEMVSSGDLSNAFEVAYIWDPSLDDGNGSYQIVFGYPLPPGISQDYFTNDPIPAMQSFWVKATAENASLAIKPEYQSQSKQLYKTTSSKVSGSTNFSWFNLQISNGSVSDRVILFGSSEESSEFNVPKLGTLASQYVEMGLNLENTEWVSRSITQTEVEIPLNIISTESGSFTFSWEFDEAFFDEHEIRLVDHLEEKTISLTDGETYSFELSENSSSRFSLVMGTVTSIYEDSDLPAVVSLDQNYPNPFNPSTVISYQLPENSKVQLQVFEMLGRIVATLVDQEMQAGTHQVTFDARHLASGMYLYRLQAGDKVFTKKLTLIK